MKTRQSEYIRLDGAMTTPKYRTHRTLPKANRYALALLALLLVLQGSMHRLHAQGAPAFDRRNDFGVGSSPQAVVIADFNGDGVADLAVANRDSNNVTVLLGSADASGRPSTDGGGADLPFEFAGPFAVGGSPSALISGDFNGDGVVDL